MEISPERRRALIDRIDIRLAIACGQPPDVEYGMLLAIANLINDHVIYRVPGGRVLRDKYLKLRDQFTGQLVLAPYIWLDLGRREARGEIANSAEHKKLIAETLKKMNDGYNNKIEDSEWWLGDGVGRSKSIRAVSVGGAQEIDFLLQHYRAQPKPKMWDEEQARHSQRGRHYLRGGTAGRVRPSGDMIIVNQLVLKLNRRQRVVYQGMVLTEPPLSRAELARTLGITDLTQISRILQQAQTKMSKWLSATRQKSK